MYIARCYMHNMWYVTRAVHTPFQVCYIHVGYVKKKKYSSFQKVYDVHDALGERHDKVNGACPVTHTGSSRRIVYFQFLKKDCITYAFCGEINLARTHGMYTHTHTKGAS